MFGLLILWDFDTFFLHIQEFHWKSESDSLLWYLLFQENLPYNCSGQKGEDIENFTNFFLN